MLLFVFSLKINYQFRAFLVGKQFRLRCPKLSHGLVNPLAAIARSFPSLARMQAEKINGLRGRDLPPLMKSLVEICIPPGLKKSIAVSFIVILLDK